MPYTYLASPYTADDKELRDIRFYHAMECCANLYKSGVTVFSPIVHCHELANTHTLPTNFSFWAQHNHAMLHECGALLVLGIDGWRLSLGVESEVLLAQELKKTIGLVNVKGELSAFTKPESW